MFKPDDVLETQHPKRVIRIQILDVASTGYGYKYIGDNYREDNNYFRSEQGSDPLLTSGFWTLVEP